MGVSDKCHTPVALSPRKETQYSVQEAGWAARPVWTGVENLSPTTSRSADFTALSYTDMSQI